MAGALTPEATFDPHTGIPMHVPVCWQISDKSVELEGQYTGLIDVQAGLEGGEKLPICSLMIRYGWYGI